MDKVLAVYRRKKEMLWVAVMFIGILVIAGFPYLKEGITGYEPDLMYHLLRIEGIRDAILEGQYPARIYHNFFDGYGYGSPLFYPDIFFVVPAIFRIMGLSPVMTWKLFALLVTLIMSCTTYFSCRYICQNWKFALCGTTLLVLSQFYQADLHNRVGISEYLAFIFIPLLAAGLYDFFAKEGKKVYLMGIAFTGMVLSHTIMTFIGLLITVAVFVLMLFVPGQRNYIRCGAKMKRLVITALVTILLAAYYLLPMAEQMLSAEFRYSTPWAHVGDYTQPLFSFFQLTGYFDYRAYVGVGIPVIMLACCRFFFERPKNIWADLFYFGGGLLFLLTTSLFPWHLLNNTIFNMIQFPYRFYPYALCFLIFGMMMIFAEHYGQDVRFPVAEVILLLALAFGGWQNITAYTGLYNTGLTEEYIAENDNCVGWAEWLPASVEVSEEKMNFEGRVVFEGGDMGFERQADSVSLTVEDGDRRTYKAPYIYYKGYQAWIDTEDGREELPVTESEDGFVEVENISGKAGTITVTYISTPVQRISLLVSLLTLLGVIFTGIYHKRRGAVGKVSEKAANDLP